MKLLLQLAAMVQLLILIASELTPRILDWRKNLAVLHPFLRKLFWVYGAFIFMVIVAFATLTFRHADAMAAREPVARSLCVFITIFWGARLLVQFAIFDANSVVATALSRHVGASTEREGYSWIYQIGYHALTVIFGFLVFVYGKAAL
jgi:hypothetical protein